MMTEVPRQRDSTVTNKLTTNTTTSSPHIITPSPHIITSQQHHHLINNKILHYSTTLPPYKVGRIHTSHCLQTSLQALYLRHLSLHSPFFASHRLSHSYYKHASLTQTLHPVSQSVSLLQQNLHNTCYLTSKQPSPFLLLTPFTLPLTPSTTNTLPLPLTRLLQHPSLYLSSRLLSTLSLYLSPSLLPPSLYLSPRLLPPSLYLSPSTTITLPLPLTPSTTTPLTLPLTPSTIFTFTVPLTPSVTTPHRTLP
ncbi:hypothetical protein Pmani_032551 [Petrolisthes manimaculis]|uniref:Uncharacterized protein n=1 Tax=Petrolisthes manimaculis TaxID=1843537 RepID=A0AAE1NRG1_9EUCA|nr:hypothetical protein Pmani_032551 [Petrolisthes manimaculis]